MPVREHKCRAKSKSAEAKNIESGTANESYDTNITELDSALVNKPSLWVAKGKSKDSAKSSFGGDVIDVGIVIVPDGKPHCFVATTILVTKLHIRKVVLGTLGVFHNCIVASHHT